MNIIWPPEETIEYDAKAPTRENGVVISALPGGKEEMRKESKKTRTSRKAEGR